MAYYYPIKCPYCLKSHTNRSVRFRLRDAVVTATRNVVRNEDDAMEMSLIEESDYMERGNEWDTDVSEAQNSYSGSRSNRRQLTEGYYTLSELEALTGKEIVSVSCKYKAVNALPSLTNESCSGDLLTSVTITTVENGKEIEKTMYDRYCDCDDDRKFYMSSGSVPSYVILLMGSSRAGKTMYLISLFHELSRKGGYLLPPTDDPAKSVASLSLNVLSEGIGETSIGKMMEDLFDHGMLPRTTNIMTNEPLIMDIRLRFTQHNVTKNALLFMRDMPGEFLTNREKQQEILKITNQFPRFDGFMMMFDPTTFDERIFSVSDAAKDRDQRRQMERLKSVLIERIVPSMDNNTINQPTSAIITKGDMFFNQRYIREIRNTGISYTNSLLAASQHESFDQQYFNEIDMGARKILERMSPNISDLMNTYFRDAFFSMVSALSRNPIGIDEDNERVHTPTAIKPWRITDPTIKLLMKLNIIPPFYNTNLRREAGENEDERKARQFRNRAVINEWGMKYCTGWVNIT